jgi:hypothetical protein
MSKQGSITCVSVLPVDPEVMARALLPGVRAQIVDARFIDGRIELAIVGYDVPAVPRVRAIITQQPAITVRLEAA